MLRQIAVRAHARRRRRYIPHSSSTLGGSSEGVDEWRRIIYAALDEAVLSRGQRIPKAAALWFMDTMATHGFSPRAEHVRVICDSLPGGPRAGQGLLTMVQLDVGTTASAHRLLRDCSRRVWGNKEVLHQISLAVKNREPAWWPSVRGTRRIGGTHFIPLLMESCREMDACYTRTPSLLQQELIKDLDSIQVKSRSLNYMDAVVAPSLKVAFVFLPNQNPTPCRTHSTQLRSPGDKETGRTGVDCEALFAQKEDNDNDNDNEDEEDRSLVSMQKTRLVWEAAVQDTYTPPRTGWQIGVLHNGGWHVDIIPSRLYLHSDRKSPHRFYSPSFVDAHHSCVVVGTASRSQEEEATRTRSRGDLTVNGVARECITPLTSPDRARVLLQRTLSAQKKRLPPRRRSSIY